MSAQIFNWNEYSNDVIVGNFSYQVELKFIRNSKRPKADKKKWEVMTKKVKPL